MSCCETCCYIHLLVQRKAVLKPEQCRISAQVAAGSKGNGHLRICILTLKAQARLKCKSIKVGKCIKMKATVN